MSKLPDYSHLYSNVYNDDHPSERRDRHEFEKELEGGLVVTSAASKVSVHNHSNGNIHVEIDILLDPRARDTVPRIVEGFNSLMKEISGSEALASKYTKNGEPIDLEQYKNEMDHLNQLPKIVPPKGDQN